MTAAGFGEFHPVDLGQSEVAYQRNRRIELKLTKR
jgi:chemotaxis protein MotB